MSGYPASGYPLARRLTVTLTLVSLAALLAALVLASYGNIHRYNHRHRNDHTVTLKAAVLNQPHGRIAYAINHPCPQEDSFNCYWDAGSRGNDIGHSFYAIRMPGPRKVGGQVCVIYWQRSFGRHWNYCDGPVGDHDGLAR